MPVTYNKPDAIISPNNVSITPLAAGATYTGTPEFNDLPDIMVCCVTDQNGLLYVDLSVDGGINYDTTLTYQLTQGSSEFHIPVKGPRTYRIRVHNNSASPQTYLRLATFTGDFGFKKTSISGTIRSDDDAIIVRAVDTSFDLAFGKFQGRTEDSKYGYLPNVGSSVVLGTSSTWKDLWYPASNSTTYDRRADLSGTFTPYFASSSAADTSKTIVIPYLDANGLEQTYTGTTDATNGQTAVSMGVTATDVSRAYVNGTIAGDISISKASSFTSGAPTTAADLIAQIPASDNQTQQCIGRVPANKRRRIRHIFVSALRDTGASGSIQGVFSTKAPGGVWRVRRPIQATTSTPYDRDISGIVLEPSTDFRIRIRDISDNNTYISGDIDYEDLEI